MMFETDNDDEEPIRLSRSEWALVAAFLLSALVLFGGGLALLVSFAAMWFA